MNKFLLKYCLSFSLILLAVFAIGGNYSADSTQYGLKTPLNQNESSVQSELSQNFFTSNSQQDNKNSNHTIFENELDDNEIKSIKDNHNNRISYLDVYNHFGIIHYLSRLKNIPPVYSHNANTFKRRFILYRVFRL